MTAKTRQSKSTSGPPRHGSLKPKDPRRGVLAMWRGIDLADVEKARAPSAKPISGVMPGVLKSMGLDRRRTEAEILRVWNHLIDPNIIAHAQPTGLRKGTLFVTVDHSVWLSELSEDRRASASRRMVLTCRVIGSATASGCFSFCSLHCCPSASRSLARSF